MYLMDATTLKNLGHDIAAANQGQLKLAIAGVSIDDVKFMSFRSEAHGLSQDYRFNFTLEISSTLDLSEVVGAAACFEVIDNIASIYIHGLITEVTYLGPRLDNEAYYISMNSMLYPLKHNLQNRVFVNKDVKQIVQDVLEDAQFNQAEFEFRITCDYPVREFTVQYNESDFDFISRLLAYEGMFYTFEQKPKGAKLVVYDDISDIPAFELGELLFETQTGNIRSLQTLYTLNRHSQLLTDNVKFKDYNYRTPETALEAVASRSSNVMGHGTDYRYGENYKTLDEGDRIARLRQQALDWQRETYLAETDCRALIPGQKFTLTNHPNDSLDGDYYIVSIEHQGDQAAALPYGSRVGGLIYKSSLTLVKAGIPYRTAVPERRYQHGVFTAIVESTGSDYAYLDEQGRYRVRLPFDLSSTPDGEASHAVRQAQTYSGMEYGMHFPLHAGTEVILTCVNGDLDRPVMLAALHNPELPNLVTSSNNSHNLLRSWGDNELLMEDRKGEERIDLFTRERKNSLRLDAKSEGHKIYLGSEEGEMEQYAAKTMHIESGDSQMVQSGNDHILTIENSHSLHTEKKQIEFKAKTDIRKKAGNNIFLRSESENIEMQVGKDMVVDVNNNLSLEVRNKDLNIICKNGNFEIKAAKAITVKGQGGGNITVSQAGGTVVIDTGGAIQIKGSTVNIDGNAVYLKGATAKEGGGGSGGGASGRDAGTDISKLKLAALDVFNHVAREAQDLAATINSPTEKNQINGEDVTVDQVQAGKSNNTAVTIANTIVSPPANEDENHFLEFEYIDQNGDKVNDVKFEVNFDGGSKVEGTMYGGFHRLDGVPDEGFNIEFVPGEQLKQELKALRKELRAALDQSLQQVKAETAALNRTWEETAAWKKPFIYVGGAMTGAGQWVADSVEGIVDIATGIVKAKLVTDQWLRDYTSHRGKAFGAFVSGDEEGFKQEMKHVESMHNELGEDISDVGEAVKTLGLIAWDDETRNMIKDFPVEYFSELHSTEKVRTGFRYGIDFALIFAAGAGAGLLAIKNSGKISDILSRMARVIEKLRLQLKARKKKVDTQYKFKSPIKHEVGATKGIKGPRVLLDEPIKHPKGEKFDLVPKHAANFENVKPVTIPEGTKIYRIVENEYSVNGGYWAFHLPENKAKWRSEYAVLDDWNKNGYYVEYVVPKGGLNAWIGKTANQPIPSQPGYVQAGGAEQIYLPSSKIDIPKNLPIHKTNWE